MILVILNHEYEIDDRFLTYVDQSLAHDIRHVGHGLELLDLGEPQPPFQTAVGAFGGLGLRQMLQKSGAETSAAWWPDVPIALKEGVPLANERKQVWASGSARPSASAPRAMPD